MLLLYFLTMGALLTKTSTSLHRENPTCADSKDQDLDGVVIVSPHQLTLLARLSV